MTGFINVDKPEGMSSAFVVGKIKKLFSSPCGHMGTLDPMASGVLPVGIGKTSRLFSYLLDKTKTYVAEFAFGYQTDTLDATGNVTESGGGIPTKEQIEGVLHLFTGEIDQIPPKYSAKCINGKRGYQLARKGVEFELAPKKVVINGIKCLAQTGENTFSFEIECKGGTYIRSLARDIAGAVNTFGTMTKLRRTASGIFTTENAIPFDKLESFGVAKEYLIKADDAVSFPQIFLPVKQAEKILNGLFENLGYPDGVYRVYSGKDFWGVGTSKDGILKIDSYVR